MLKGFEDERTVPLYTMEYSIKAFDATVATLVLLYQRSLRFIPLNKEALFDGIAIFRLKKVKLFENKNFQ